MTTFPPPPPPPSLGRGAWTGALLANAVGLAAMIVLAAGPALSGSSLFTNVDTELGVSAGSSLASLFLYVALAAGGSATMPSSFLSSLELSYRPLTLTLVGYGLIAWLVVRHLRRAGIGAAPGSGSAWAVQLLRVAAVHIGVLVAAVALSGLGHSGVPSLDDEFGTASMSADLGSTVFNGLLTLAVALVVATVLGLPGIVPAWERGRALVAGALRGVIVLCAASCVVTVAAVCVLVFGRGQRIAEQLPVDLALSPGMAIGELGLAVLSAILVVPNLAGYALLFGMGAPMELGGIFFTFAEPQPGGSVGILDATRENAWYWLWPGVVAVLLVVTGWYAARRSPVGASGRRPWWPLTVVLPLGLLLVAQGIRIAVGFSGFSTTIGFDSAWVILLAGGYGALVGLLGAALHRRRQPELGPVAPVAAPTPPAPPASAPPAPPEAAAVPTSPAPPPPLA